VRLVSPPFHKFACPPYFSCILRSWHLWCLDNLKINYVIHLVIRSVVLRDEANGHTDRQYCSISSIMLGFLGRKALHYINGKYNIAMLFLCPSVSVRCPKISERCDPVLQIPVCTLWSPLGALTNNKVEDMRTFLCEQHCWLAIFCVLTDCG
jgi:hypothetical protein